MKSFLQFLKESKIDEELNESNEEIFSIEGDNLVKEDRFQIDEDDVDSLLFRDVDDSENDETIVIDESIILEDNDSKDKTYDTGFGGEIYVSLDAESLMNDIKEVSESKKQQKDDEKNKESKTV